MDIQNNKTQEGKYICPKCHLEFVREGSLFSHIDSLHEEEKPTKMYECSVCDYKTKEFSHFQHHAKTHKGVEGIVEEAIKKKFFVCSICQKKFKKKHRLREHQSICHENRKPYSCDICGQDFVALKNYRNHTCLRKENNVKCIFCDEKFKSQKDMFTHVKEKHKKPHVCPVCGNSFERKENLRQHMETHSSDKAARKVFVCSVEGCNSSFTRKSNLNTHMQTIHGGILPYSCEICGRTFRYPSLLAKHAELHKKEPEPEIIEIDMSLF